MLNKVKDFFNKVVHKFLWFFNWIKKSCEYAWFLKDDYDWDYSYLLKLMQYKLSRMRIRLYDDWSGYGLIDKEHRETLDEILFAEEMIQQLIDDDIIADKWKTHFEKWGKITINSKSIGFDPKFGEELFLIEFSGKKAVNTFQKEQENQEFRKLADLEEEERKRLAYRLFNHIASKYRNWWN